MTMAFEGTLLGQLHKRHEAVRHRRHPYTPAEYIVLKEQDENKPGEEHVVHRGKGGKETALGSLLIHSR